MKQSDIPEELIPQIKKAIELNDKKGELLNEMLETIEFEKAKFQIVVFDESPRQYGLYLIEQNRCLTCGGKARIRSFMRLRNHQMSQVYMSKKAKQLWGDDK